MSIRLPDPHKDQPLDDDIVYDVTMAEAERYANGERFVLAYLVRRVITAYLARTAAQQPVEYRWTDTDGTLNNRDGLIICGAHAGDGTRCIREAGHKLSHFYRERTIR